MPKLLSIKPVIKTIMSNKNDSFSFENDPGKLEDKDDTDFTFADIPVLGNDKKKDAFSLDQISDENQDNPSLASFENLLSEAPQADGNGDETQDEENSDKFDASASTIDVQRVINARDIKKKKKIILILGLVGGFVALIIVGTMIVLPIISPPEKDKDEMTPEEKAAFEAKQKQEEIAGMLASSDSLLEAKEYDRSLASYKNVLRIDRKRSLAHTGCGKSYEKLLNIPDAKSSYQKAIDTVSGIPDPYHLLASILIKEGEIEKSLILLERGKKKFADNPQILYLLGDSYYDSGDTEKSLENYRKVPKDALNKESLIKFGSILREESKQEANELYHFGGKKFKDFNLFLEAAKSTDQSKDKVVILTEAVQVLSDNEEKIDEVKYLLAKALSEDGNNAKALETLCNINISELDKEYCCQLVNLATKSGMSDVKNYCLKILASNPNEIPLQQSIQSELISALPREGAHIISHLVFGSCSHHEKSINQLIEMSDNLIWPITWLDGDACSCNCLTSTQVTAVSGVEFSPVIIEGERLGTYYEDDFAEYCYLGNIHSTDLSGTNSEQGLRAFEKMSAALKSVDMDFSNVIRMWNYLDDLLSWYDEFNVMRTAFFNENDVFNNIVPAGTGIGAGNPSGAAYVGDLIAVKIKDENTSTFAVPSPLQCPAIDYKSSFSRAVEIDSPDSNYLSVSGTASIEPGGKTVNLDDTAGQIDLTMKVIAGILESRGFEWSDTVKSIAYFKDISEVSLFENYLKQNGIPDFPVAISHADICRDDLLFELELDAVK